MSDCNLFPIISSYIFIDVKRLSYQQKFNWIVHRNLKIGSQRMYQSISATSVLTPSHWVSVSSETLSASRSLHVYAHGWGICSMYTLVWGHSLFLTAEICLCGSKPESQTSIICTLPNKPPPVERECLNGWNISGHGISQPPRLLMKPSRISKRVFFANYGRLPGKIEPFLGKTMFMLSLFGSENWILSDSHLGMHGSLHRRL